MGCDGSIVLLYLLAHSPSFGTMEIDVVYTSNTAELEEYVLPKYQRLLEGEKEKFMGRARP